MQYILLCYYSQFKETTEAYLGVFDLAAKI